MHINSPGKHRGKVHRTKKMFNNTRNINTNLEILYIFFCDSDFGQKYSFFSGFLAVALPNQGVQLKARLF